MTSYEIYKNIILIKNEKDKINLLNELNVMDSEDFKEFVASILVPKSKRDISNIFYKTYKIADDKNCFDKSIYLNFISPVLYYFTEKDDTFMCEFGINVEFFLDGIQYVICKGCLNFHCNIYPSSLILCSDDLYVDNIKVKVYTPTSVEGFIIVSDVYLTEPKIKEQVQEIIEAAINNMFDMFSIDHDNTKYILNSNF